ncbi:hypothetical protein AB0C89_24540 [Streptomyces sp. NPDC048491]|uniref:hypothetical protein n=1 Tax=unclassified Streptomyces TaxID=2593676 RepID=UPI003436AFDA
MKNWTSGRSLPAPIEITSCNVRRGDVILIGGRLCRVTDLLQLPGGAKRLLFESGEQLTMHVRTRFIASRGPSRW